MKTTVLIKLVLLPVFVLFFAACPAMYSPLPTPSADLVQEAAEIAHSMATLMGASPENRLTEMDRCSGPPCFYTIYFTTTDDVARFGARLRANGLVDPEPYTVTYDVELFYALADHPIGKDDAAAFESERSNYLLVNGRTLGPDGYGHAPLHSTLWQISREMAPDSYGNINFKLYEVSRVVDHYTFAGRPIPDNIVEIGVEHGR